MIRKSVRTMRIGEAKVAFLNSGDSVSTIAESVNIPPESRTPFGKTLEEQYLAPTWTIHIGLPQASILVDPNNYDLLCLPGSPSVPRGYRPLPLEEQMREVGLNPAGVTHVVITHRHFDHYAGVTKRDERGRYVPAFPRAKHYLGRRDWEATDTLREDARKFGVVLTDPEEDVRSLGVIARAKLLELVDGDLELDPAVRIISAPGESPGHQVVRVKSQGQMLYCIGDLYHHPIEVEHPEWMASWAAPKTNVESRRVLAEHTASEGATVIAGHMQIGRIERTENGFRWVEI